MNDYQFHALIDALDVIHTELAKITRTIQKLEAENAKLRFELDRWIKLAQDYNTELARTRATRV